MFQSRQLNALEELRKNGQKISHISDQITRAPNEDFVKLFPSKYGVQITHESWGFRLISPPTIPREHNNFWSVKVQTDLLLKWFHLMEKTRSREKGQRLLAETIHHTTSGLPFVPNPIEAHTMIDTLTSLWESDDNLSIVDHTIRVETAVEIEGEYCEIRIGIIPDAGIFPKPDFVPVPPLPSLPEDEVDRQIDDLYSRLSALSSEELVKLFHVLLVKDRIIRSNLPYSIMPDYYPLRRRTSVSKKKYRAFLKDRPFAILGTETPTIATKASFRSYEQYAADVFIEELYQFLRNEKDWLETLQNEEYDLTILQRAKLPDGDNIPFDKLHHLLKVTYRIPLSNTVKIRHSPKMDYGVCLILTPANETENIPVRPLGVLAGLEKERR